MGICAVCQDEMDMDEFGDARQTTETCYKLECEHAFHTKCVIDFVRRTHFDCVMCNRHHIPEVKLSLDGLVKQAFQKTLRRREVRDINKEYKAVSKECREVVKKIQKEHREFIKAKQEEYGLNELRKRQGRVASSLKKMIKKTMLKISPLTAGALDTRYFNRLMFELEYPYRIRRYPFRRIRI